MIHRKQFEKSLLLLALVLAGANLACNAAVGQEIVITLGREPINLDRPTVRIGDVADVYAGSTAEQRKVEQLDLELFAEQSECEITKSQIRTRLLLAGYNRKSCHLTGPEALSVRRSSPSQMRSNVERLLAVELSRQFAIRSDRVRCRLTNTRQLESLEGSTGTPPAAIRLQPKNRMPLGRTRLSGEAVGADGIGRPATFDVEVSVMTTVAVTSQPIARGTVITADQIHEVQRAITSQSDYANPQALIGRTTSRYVAGNEIVLASQLVSLPRGGTDTVRRNDLVDVVIKVGNGEIRLKNAKAMESGKVGETIEIMNPQTNRRINASIVGPNLATILPATQRRLR